MMRYTPGCTGDGCDCEACTNIRIITSWGADSTTIGNGATERNGNWEILSGKLRVATADAIITWDAGISDWHLRFDTSAMSWNTTGSVATDYTKELRFIFNWVDNSNYDYASLRLVGSIYLVSFGERVAGTDTVLLPVAGSGITSKQFIIKGPILGFTYKDEILHIVEFPTTCSGGGYDTEYDGRTWYRPRVNNTIGIGTGPSWTGNVDIGDVYITSPAATPCASETSDCWFPTRPAMGATNDIVPNSLTVTIAGVPTTHYPYESVSGSNYSWGNVTLWGASSFGKQTGDIYIQIGFGGPEWLLTNGGSPRTDADAWSSLNIPPVFPNTDTCTITGNY